MNSSLNNIFKVLKPCCGITRTPDCLSPGLGASPSPTKPCCDLRVSEPDYTTKLGRASQLVEFMKGHKVFEIDFAIFQ